MRRVLVLCLLMIAFTPMATPRVVGSQVLYVGGTVETLQEGVLGRLDTTSEVALNFNYAGGKLSIPFEKIDSYEYSQQVARHLGVLPAIAVGLVKRRQSRHFFCISYHDESRSPQVAIFEVSKQTPHTLLAILRARAPRGSKPQPYGKCGVPLHGVRSPG